jgi:LAO/AO transport system kinase
MLRRGPPPHPPPQAGEGNRNDRQAGEGGLTPLRAGGKSALAAALARLEEAPDAPETLGLLDAAFAAPRAHVIGVTGPPGVGKSSLIGALIAAWRKAGKTVAVIAVDPSSRVSGGALLGDRTRIGADPADAGIFIRSMAARDRLGGLAALTHAAMVLMRALFDIVVIETVGVGQSETAIAGAADTIVLCIQPGSGDGLQFMKAGIVEIPHIMAVTKSDMGAEAERARREAKAALRASAPGDGAWRVPVLSLSAQTGDRIERLVSAVAEHWAWLATADRLAVARRLQSEAWLVEAIRERFGREGLRRAAIEAGEGPPFRRLAALTARLS